MADLWVDVQRLTNMTYMAPGIYHGTWEARKADGWVWVENLDVAQYGVSSQRISQVIADRGDKNVSVGHPWDAEAGMPGSFDRNTVGLYVQGEADSISELVFTLYRDCDRWLDIDPDEVFG